MRESALVGGVGIPVDKALVAGGGRRAGLSAVSEAPVNNANAVFLARPGCAGKADRHAGGFCRNGTPGGAVIVRYRPVVSCDVPGARSADVRRYRPDRRNGARSHAGNTPCRAARDGMSRQDKEKAGARPAFSGGVRMSAFSVRKQTRGRQAGDIAKRRFLAIVPARADHRLGGLQRRALTRIEIAHMLHVG